MNANTKKRMTARPGAAPYRQLPPTSGANGGDIDLRSLKNDVERLKWRQRFCGWILIILGVAALAGLIAWLIILTTNANGEQNVINGIQNNMTVVQNDLIQLILETGGNVTVLQRGNVSWTLSTVLSTGSDPACVTPADYINQGSGGVGSLISGTYVLQNVQLGGLNFTVLVLNPPAHPLTLTLPSDSPSLVQLCIVYFSPTVNVLSSISADWPVNSVPIFEFTSSNLARIVSTPDCLLSGSCYIEPYFYESYSGNGAYSIQQSTAYPNADQYFLQWVFSYLNSATPALGTNYTIRQPLQLMLPTS